MRYDACWYENADEVRITDSGTLVASGTVGTHLWYPGENCSERLLTLEAVSNGLVIATETAKFGCGYIRNVTARQLWPHKKVEVCYTLADDIGDVAGEGMALVLTCDTRTAATVIGDARCTPGFHRIVWCLDEDGVNLAGNPQFVVSYGEAVGVSEAVAINKDDAVMQLIPGGSELYVQNGMAGHWDGLENAGRGVRSTTASTWKDLSGNGWDAEKVGSYGSWSDDGYVFTRSGTGYFALPSGFLPALGKSWTIEAYVRPTAAAKADYAGVCGGHGPNSTGMAFQSWSGPLVAFVEASQNLVFGKLELIGDSEPWPSGEFVHLAMTVDNANGVASAWRDGVVVDSSNFTAGTAPAMTFGQFWIGRAYDDGNRLFDGEVCAVRAYNRALTSEEIQSNYSLDMERHQERQGLSVAGSPVDLGYSPIDAGSVTLEVNGTVVHTATESGTYAWTPEKPGTYVLTHRAGDAVFTRRVVVSGTDDARELEVGWLDGPVSNCFPNIYASVTNVVIAETLASLPEGAFDGCAGLGMETKNGFVFYKGCLLGLSGECPANVVLPEGTQVIADGAFRNCSTLASIYMPESVKGIGAGAFADCTDLEEIVIPEGVEEIGDGAFLNCTYVQQMVLPSSLRRIGKFAFANCASLAGIECLDGLQSIGDWAFSNCWRMLSVALPASVDEIGAHAFYNCKAILGVSVPAHVDTIAHLFPDVYQTIESVAIAEGETELVAGVFSGCARLEEVALSDLISEIPDSAFEGCSELRQIRFPSNLVRIGNRAFYGCGQRLELKFPEGLEVIGDDAFNGLQQVHDLVCPASVRSIGARAFRGVWNDEEVKLPAGLEGLGADAFANCPAIRRISLPALTTTIKSAFPNAYSQINSVKILGAPDTIPASFCQDVVQLSDIKIPESVTNICNSAFAGLSNLAAIELPPNLEAIGEYAFSGDGRIPSVALPQSVKSVGYRAFYNCDNIRVVNCSGELAILSYLFPSAYGQITTVYINEGTTRLIDDLFSGCTKLSEIDLPLGITDIGARAFQDCSALAAFGVPQCVVSIGADVFNGCTGLTALSLPEGLAAIPSGAFRNCRTISSIVIPSSVTYIAADAFNGCSALKSISYLGSAPEYASGCYNGTPSDLTSHVVKGTRGWDGVPTSKTLPEYWPTSNSRTIDYWEPNTFVATFNANGGAPATTSVVQTTGMTYVLPEEDPVMTGARFDGWWTQPVNGGRIKSTTKVEVTRAQTFYAHWKYNEYSVRFDANGGFGEMADLALTVNTAAELTKTGFLRKGFRFAGWALSPEGDMAFADGASVENLSFDHGAVVTLYAVWEESAWGAADYLDAIGRAFAFAGDAGWVADDDVSHDGIGSMRSGAIGAADEGLRTTSVLRTVVVGDGSGAFWWKVDCEPNEGSDYYDYCLFSVDGVEVEKIAGTIEWTNVEYAVSGAGEHILEWVFTRDDYDEDETLYANAAWVDEFVWTPTPVTLSFDANGAEGDAPTAITKYAGFQTTLPDASRLTKSGMVFVGWSDGENTFLPGDMYTMGSANAVLTAVWEEKVWTLGEAANLSDIALSTGGNADWTVDLATNFDGVASIRSGTIGDDQETWVSLTVTNAGVISFRALVSGEYNRGKLCDYLAFAVDGAGAFSSHDANWSNVVVEVAGTGPHTLKWTYRKNGSKSAGEDCAWLDEIAWTPSAAPADPIPEIENPTPTQIEEVLEQAEDPKLAAEITDETEYAAFRAWSASVKPSGGGETPAGAAAVMAAPTAWQSYALGTEKLLAEPIAEEDLTVEMFEPAAEAGKFDFTVSVKDVEVGSAAAKENLKKVFGLQGATTLEESAFSGDSVDVEFGTPEGGKVKFTATPADPGAKTFFMRMTVKP